MFEAKAVSAGGEYMTSIFRVKRLSIGGQDYTDLIFGLSGLNSLGFDFLSRHNLVFDFPGGRLLLSNRTNWDARDETNKSGLKIGAESQTLFVYDVDERSTSHAAGIRKGDRIIAINGSMMGASDIFSGRKILSQEQGTEITMRIEREGTTMEKTFRLGTDPFP